MKVSRGVAARVPVAPSTAARAQPLPGRQRLPGQSAPLRAGARQHPRVTGSRRSASLRAAGLRRVVAVAADEDVFVEELSNENAHITFKVSVSPEFAKKCYDGILEVSDMKAALWETTPFKHCCVGCTI